MNSKVQNLTDQLFAFENVLLEIVFTDYQLGFQVNDLLAEGLDCKAKVGLFVVQGLLQELKFACLFDAFSDFSCERFGEFTDRALFGN